MRCSFYQNAEYSPQDDLHFLRCYAEYDRPEEDRMSSIPFTYEQDSPGLTKIRDQWNLKSIMGTGNELQKIARLKKFARSLLHFPGKELQERRYDACDCFEIIRSARKEGYALNCRYIALIFTQILLAAGFRARWVGCLPMDLHYNECHCVTEVFVGQYDKWIVVDAAFDVFYFDKSGTPLNLYEIRRHVLLNKPFCMPALTAEDFRYVWEYWTGHVFRFRFLLKNCYNMLSAENKTYVYLEPKGFVVSDKEIVRSDASVTKYTHYYNNRLFWEERQRYVQTVKI